MRFLLSSLGSAGDVFPFLGLALELRRRGHEVHFATNAHFEDLITNHGISFSPLGTDDEYHATIQNPDLWKPQKAFPHVFRHLKPVLKRQYDFCLEQQTQGDTVALVNCFGFGALLAQETHGLPVITVHLQPAVLWSRHAPPTIPGVVGPNWLKSLMYGLGERFVIDPVVCPFLNDWRASLGLPPVRRITRWWNSPYGVLCMFPEWFAPPQSDWPSPLMQTDFPLWNAGSADPLPTNVEAFLKQGSPPIVFTPGTANVHGREFFGAAVDACQILDRRGLFLTRHPEQIPHPLPATVLHVPYLPLDTLLPHAAAFVHHGGIGSTSQGLLAGTPQVLMPLAHDQFDNAHRITKLGVGSSLPANRFNGRSLTSHLGRLLGNAAVIRACRETASRLAPHRGLSSSADAILEHVSKSQSRPVAS